MQKALSQTSVQIPAPSHTSSEIFTSESQPPCLQNGECHRTHLLGMARIKGEQVKNEPNTVPGLLLPWGLCPRPGGGAITMGQLSSQHWCQGMAGGHS